ncbi:MAG: WYL domain-containing protein [Verrucomicrobiales bacterium]|jgi:proteasome accessory factor B|nr:WYL domain-containing protein [Verrucomicrobiales bacterium]
MQRIFAALKAGNVCGRSSLAAEIEVTEKTIQRDIDFMRERLNMPIAYNRAKQSYEFSEPIENFPMIELSESELVAVFVAQKALAQYRGTPFEHSLRAAFEKLTSNLHGKISLSWDDLDSRLSFRNFEASPLDLKTFQAVGAAVRNGVLLEFDYKKSESTTYQRRVIEPYHLGCVQNRWYCFGEDTAKRGEIRVFVLSRMKNARSGDRKFKAVRKFSIEKYLQNSFGVFSGKESHRVCLWFDAFAAQYVRERAWHPSQKIRELANGELELSLQLSDLAEIEQWILSWGAHAKALAPRALITRLRETIRKQGNYYGC